jgi:hypothetical protein
VVRAGAPCVILRLCGRFHVCVCVTEPGEPKKFSMKQQQFKAGPVLQTVHRTCAPACCVRPLTCRTSAPCWPQRSRQLRRSWTRARWISRWVVGRQVGGVPGLFVVCCLLFVVCCLLFVVSMVCVCLVCLQRGLR